MKIAFLIVLGLIFLMTILTQKILNTVPLKELRRRARAHKNSKTTAIYKLAAFGKSSEIFLWLLISLSAAGLILIAANKTWWLGLIVVVVIIWFLHSAQKKSIASDWTWSLASPLVSVITPIVAFLQPVLGHVANWPHRLRQPVTGMYEKEDLIEFFKLQARQVDNRISQDDLKVASKALSFSDKMAGSIMTPRRKLKWVVASEVIGPMVMDELHKTGHTRFAVVKEITKSANPEIVGSLYLKDLLEHLEEKGRIRDIMQPGVHYINESQNLRQALEEFLQSGQYLLVVNNDFEEIVGVLTMEDVLKQIFGKIKSNEIEHQAESASEG